MARVRQPYVAGMFYAGTPEALREQLEWCFLHELGPGELPEVNPARLEGPLALVSPHAGYQYSGPVAAHAYHFLARRGRPETAVIVGTNHTGLGAPVSIALEGTWETPLGALAIDHELARAIAAQSELIGDREEAFLREHSVEVQLPFLQYLFPGVKFVPLVPLDQRFSTALELGRAIATAIEELNRSAVVVASSDFTHYEPQARAEAKDRRAIEHLLEFDLQGFYEEVERERITICGYGAIAAAVEAACLLGAETAELLKYATSGETSGFRSEVVGYASIAFYQESR